MHIADATCAPSVIMFAELNMNHNGSLATPLTKLLRRYQVLKYRHSCPIS